MKTPKKKRPGSGSSSSSKANSARFRFKGGGKGGPKGKKGGSKKGGPRKEKLGPKRSAALAPTLKPAENPRAYELAQKIAQLTLDKKALDVVILDVRGKTSYADYFVIASGESERQVAAMADGIQSALKEDDKLYVIGSEGQETGNWVLLDYGEVVVHLFYAEVRAFYDLEGLWADANRERVLPATPVPFVGQA
ncbi:MAG: ribosome silencing factor [Myxococcaceae bacterium]